MEDLICLLATVRTLKQEEDVFYIMSPQLRAVLEVQDDKLWKS